MDLREIDWHIEPGRHYSPAELDLKADALLRADADSMICEECGLKTYPPTNRTDPYTCTNGHEWAQPGKDASKRRGVRGDNQILLENHLRLRRKYEVYNRHGVPEPSIHSGIFSRPYRQKYREQDMRPDV